MQHIKPRNTHDCKKEKKTKNEQKNQLNPPKKKNPQNHGQNFIFLQISTVLRNMQKLQ